MRYPPSEKLESIRVGRATPSAGPGAPWTSWVFRRPHSIAGTIAIEAFDEAGLGRSRLRSRPVWNRIQDDIRGPIVELALDEPKLSPRELAVTFTGAKGYFISEASVYRLLKAHDLITPPAFVVIKAADEFHDRTTAPNPRWQSDFTYLKVIGWGRVSIGQRAWTTSRATSLPGSGAPPCGLKT